ncbi:MAG: DUF308 domain-containing protein [Actinomycetota bacterium]|jgi:uncharacterized membrane protein HdeD (DUF308 family)
MSVVLSQEEIIVGDAIAAALEKTWKWFLVGGVLTTLLGLVFLSWRHATLSTVTWFAGLLLFMIGLLEFGGALVAPRHRVLQIVQALLTIGVGITTVVWPHITLFVLGLLLGWILVLSGLVNVIAAFVARRVVSLWPSFVKGLIEVALGIWALRHPGDALVILVVVVGLWAVVSGLLGIVGAFGARHASRDWAAFKAGAS